ncbi:hypothetical protein BDZ89DRAFT_1065277 [Hymenopellis radicata]|nr:hypothetical protein BDZ89DRAFT_1065277 [Hymenopellis radicata]
MRRPSCWNGAISLAISTKNLPTLVAPKIFDQTWGVGPYDGVRRAHHERMITEQLGRPALPLLCATGAFERSVAASRLGLTRRAIFGLFSSFSWSRGEEKKRTGGARGISGYEASR